MEFFSNLGDWPLSKKGRGDKFPIFSWCGSDDTTDFVMPTYDLTESTLESMSRFVSRQLPLLLFLVQIYQIELSKMILSLSKILHWLTWKLKKKKKKNLFMKSWCLNQVGGRLFNLAVSLAVDPFFFSPTHTLDITYFNS